MSKFVAHHQESFFEAMDTLLANYGSKRKEALIQIANYSAVEYTLEHRTLSIDPGRQMGKTSWVARTANDTDVVIVPNRRVADYLKSLGCTAHIFTKNSFTQVLLKPPVLFIDDCRNVDLPLIYNHFIKEYSQTVVILGNCSPSAHTAQKEYRISADGARKLSSGANSPETTKAPTLLLMVYQKIRDAASKGETSVRIFNGSTLTLGNLERQGSEMLAVVSELVDNGFVIDYAITPHPLKNYLTVIWEQN